MALLSTIQNRIAGNPVVEGYVDTVLEHSKAKGERNRDELAEEGVPVETYRRVELDDALKLLAV